MIEKKSKPSFLKLFLEFLKIGATGFGGVAVFEYIRREVCEKRDWLDSSGFDYGIALIQMVPGAAVAQISAYVGLRVRGIKGGIVCFLGSVIPAFILMIVLSFLYQRVYHLPEVVSIFKGLQAIILAVIVNAFLFFGRAFVRDLRGALFGVLSAVLFMVQVHPIMVILVSLLAGILFYKVEPFPGLKSEGLRVGYSYKSIIALLLILGGWFLFLFFVNRDLFNLALVMFRVDLFAFGGGFAAAPIMFYEVVNHHQWLDAKTLINGIALGQITPGPVIITATFIGYLLYGPIGALVSTISIFYPSIIILSAVVPYFDRMRNSAYFSRALGGILCAFVGLLASLAVSFGLEIDWDTFQVIICICALIALLLRVEIIWVILSGLIIVSLRTIL